MALTNGIYFLALWSVGDIFRMETDEVTYDGSVRFRETIFNCLLQKRVIGAPMLTTLIG